MGARQGIPDRPSLVYRLALNFDGVGNVTGGFMERYDDHELAECVVVALDYFGPFDDHQVAIDQLWKAAAARWGFQGELLS